MALTRYEIATNQVFVPSKRDPLYDEFVAQTKGAAGYFVPMGAGIDVITSSGGIVANDWLNPQKNEQVITDKTYSTVTGVELNLSGELVNIPVVYGYRRVVPPRVFNQVKPSDNKILYCVYALSEGYTARPDRIFVNDEQIELPASISPFTVYTITKGTYANLIQVEFSIGPTNSVTMPTLIREITGQQTSYASFINSMEGITYLVLKFTNPSTGSPFTELPKVTVDMFGRNLRNAASHPTHAAGENQLGGTNPADVLLDLMTNTRYGAGIPDSRIDATSLATLKSSFDTTLVLLRNGVAQKRATCNYILNTGRSVIENIRELGRQFNIIITYANGKFRFTPEYQASSSATITETDLIGSIVEQKPDFSVKYNKVKVTYQDPVLGYSNNIVSFSDATALALDGKLLEIDLSYDAVTDPYVASSIAQMVLRKSRDQSVFTFTLRKTAHQFTVGDVITISQAAKYHPTTEDLLVAAKSTVVRIISMSLNSDYTFGIQAVTHSNAFYTPVPTAAIEYASVVQPANGGSIIAAAPTAPLIPATTNPTPPPPTPIVVAPAPADTVIRDTATVSTNTNEPPTLMGTPAVAADFYRGIFDFAQRSFGGVVGRYQAFSAHSARDTPDNGYGFKNLVERNLATATTTLTFRPYLTYRYRDTTKAADLTERLYKGQRKIFYSYPVAFEGGAYRYGWINQQIAGSPRSLYTVIFDPQTPADPQIRGFSVAPLTRTLDPAQVIEARAYNYHAPYLEYFPAERYYAPPTFTDKTFGDGLSYYLGGNAPSLLQWQVSDTVYSRKQQGDPRNTTEFSTKTGTISTTLNSYTVTGVGTSFTTQVSPGFALYDANRNIIGLVGTVTNNTSLQLVQPSTATRSSVAYQTESSWIDVKFWIFLKGSAAICEWIGNMRLNLKVKDFPETGAVTFPSTFNDTITKGSNRLGQPLVDRLNNYNNFVAVKGVSNAWTKPTV
jgi:hypothetical protein